MDKHKRLGEGGRITISVLFNKGFSNAEIERDIGVHRQQSGETFDS